MFVTVIVYVPTALFFDVAGPLAATARSAPGVTVTSRAAAFVLSAPRESVTVAVAW